MNDPSREHSEARAQSDALPVWPWGPNGGIMTVGLTFADHVVPWTGRFAGAGVDGVPTTGLRRADGSGAMLAWIEPPEDGHLMRFFRHIGLVCGVGRTVRRGGRNARGIAGYRGPWRYYGAYRAVGCKRTLRRRFGRQGGTA